MASLVRRGWWRIVWSDSFRAAALAAISLGVGVAVNGARSQPLSWAYHSPAERLRENIVALKSASSPEVFPVPPSAGQSRIVELETFQAFMSEGKGIVIDARAAPFYRQGHVPGAINLARETFAEDYARQGHLAGFNKSKEIVIYCSEADCPDAGLVADALSQLGYQDLSIYKEGWEEWMRAGLPQEVSQVP